MTLVGFKKMTIGVFDETGKIPTANQFVIEGKQDKGATVSAEITGLSKEPTKVYGSDIAYYVSQKGTGDVSVNFGLLDLPEDVNDKILGYVTNENKISFLGEDTEPPYCAVLLESSDLSGDSAMLAVFKGRFSRESINLNTLTNDAFEPDAEEYVFTAIANDADGEANGQSVAKYIGKEEASITALKGLVFPAGE
ncbi:major tail protein [Enterococcus durans]|uniref:major tail protein n=1 Tax=Enterococcus durans TaxID=53345 RepID=UPI001C8C0253|nr:major tail protein [Enterococcus durans]MBX9040547.1 phage tail protein [Enterococcus durans]MBX9077271.1 phage tail protein [Enterococcus durans]